MPITFRGLSQSQSIESAPNPPCGFCSPSRRLSPISARDFVQLIRIGQAGEVRQCHRSLAPADRGKSNRHRDADPDFRTGSLFAFAGSRELLGRFQFQFVAIVSFKSL